jgi:hypothetical protein
MSAAGRPVLRNDEDPIVQAPTVTGRLQFKRSHITSARSVMAVKSGRGSFDVCLSHES